MAPRQIHTPKLNRKRKQEAKGDLEDFKCLVALVLICGLEWEDEEMC